MNDKITKDFARAEFACNGHDCCGKSAPIDTRLVALLQRIRDEVGYPIYVNSGFRCRRHNADVPGASINSFHTLGMAADIRCPNVMASELYDTANDVIRELGYGFPLLYSAQNFIHVDIRDVR